MLTRAAACLVLLAGCGGGETPKPRRQMPELPFGYDTTDAVTRDASRFSTRLLTQRPSSGFLDERREVIRDEDAWQAIWNAGFAGRRPNAPMPKVNFEREMVIVAALGRRPSFGYSIHVERIALAGDELEVHLRIMEPTSGCTKVDAITTEPVVMVGTKPSELPVRFVERTVLDCPDRPY